MLNRLLNRDPYKAMAHARAEADRVAVTFLEGHAIAGTITADMLRKVSRTINRHPDDLLEMIPDRRRPSHHAKAMAGLRAAGLLASSGQMMREDEHEIE
jgi:hypothetical protein